FILTALIVYELSFVGIPDENISAFHYLGTALLFVAFSYAARWTVERRARYYISSAIALTWTMSLLLFLLGFQSAALRYFSYLEWLLPVMAVALLCLIPRKHVGVYVLSR